MSKGNAMGKNEPNVTSPLRDGQSTNLDNPGGVDPGLMLNLLKTVQEINLKVNRLGAAMPSDSRKRKSRSGRTVETPQEYKERVGVDREVVAIALLVKGETCVSEVAKAVGVYRHTLAKSPQFKCYQALLGTLRAGGSVLSFVNSQGVRPESDDDE
jgi:hypothetical protein